MARDLGPSVTLAWNPSPGTNIASYNVYWGGVSRDYTNLVTVDAPITNAVVTGLSPGSRYYFAATALNTAGLESDYSTEISYTIPEPPPPPTNFLVSVTVQQSGDLTNWLAVTNLPALSFTNPTGAPLYWRALMDIQAQ